MSYDRKAKRGPRASEFLKKYRLYDIKNNDAIIGDFTIHELSEFLGMKEGTIREGMSKNRRFRWKYYAAKVEEE